MSKRPCAIAIASDNSTIICADKFGDVYSLPLFPVVDSQSQQVLEEEVSRASPKGLESVPKTFFSPAANDLTVHSVRNRKALENQLRQTNQHAEKAEPAFEHKLLLGHVSMLTDIAVVDVANHSYIITADRDEHIRVSRSIPQAHIIEGFCLGHKDFVSRLCFPESFPYLLLSGGGDDTIYLWNWKSQELLDMTDLKSHVDSITSDYISTLNRDGPKDQSISPESRKIAVSNICYMKSTVGAEQKSIIIVTCEG